jgi:hypothetical protein
VRACAGVSVSGWYRLRSLLMNTMDWQILTISMDTYREMGIR